MIAATLAVVDSWILMLRVELKALLKVLNGLQIAARFELRDPSSVESLSE
jgi:hypothetical protein